ncbi:CbiX/SirB N-terminal domain-containing protein [Limnobacter humi]|uniref:CbiX/SirB N-terminal domain-containing protein n=1 Tax=Limnobacter humi TaxID=1778671 RepID=A0ABT1WHE0_9BURK|nr:CbiX/SirB N-terminal domain-containing protein [Limnobacter humi]MCQ8896923.1 CbiX/SirB N-terminal domain-containing protein [Limnobacter humi]
MTTNTNPAIVLFGHGARDPQWAEPMKHLQQMLRERCPGALVELAFLELMAPSLPDCVQQLAEHGATQIQIVPIFFGKGGHLKNDFPALLATLNQQHPALQITATAAVGQWDAVWLAIADEIMLQTSAAGPLSHPAP